MDSYVDSYMIGHLPIAIHHQSLGHLRETSGTNVKRTKSILLCKEKLCLYIHESLEHHGSPWKLMIANTSGGGE